MADILTDFCVTQRCGEDELSMSWFVYTSVDVVVSPRSCRLEPRFQRQETATPMVELEGEVELTVSPATCCMFSMSSAVSKDGWSQADNS